MANVSGPMGLQLSTPGGKRYVEPVERAVAASRSKDLMTGDAYKSDGAGGVTKATATSDTVIGVVGGLKLAPLPADPQASASQRYIAAADAGTVLGIEDQDAEFEVQITTVAATDIPGYAMLVDADGQQSPAQSRVTVALDDGSHKQFRLLRLIDRPDNAYGANAKVVVKLNTPL